MRIYLSLIALLLLFSPTSASAAPLEFQFLNSELTFGVQAHDRGWDGSLWRNGDWDGPLWFEAEPGVLLEHRLLADAGGSVVQSTYIYAGGFLHIVGDGAGGLDIFLPLELLEVAVPERDGPLVRPAPSPHGFGGDVYFELGRALLDPATASALGVGRHILGGDGTTDMAYGECGDAFGGYSSDVRVACDGATYVTLDVPEPAMLWLLGLGAMALVVRLRWRRAGAAPTEEPPVVS